MTHACNVIEPTIRFYLAVSELNIHWSSNAGDPKHYVVLMRLSFPDTYDVAAGMLNTVVTDAVIGCADVISCSNHEEALSPIAEGKSILIFLSLTSCMRSLPVVD